MFKKLTLISVFAGIVSVLCMSHTAHAHFTVEDAGTGVKAIFHVTPDHDPIAGKESVISFDFAKTDSQTEGYAYSLKVKPTKGEAVDVPINVLGNVIIGTYAFPGRGFYDIILTATNEQDGTVSRLQYGQRVSRGVVAEKKEPFGLLEIGAISGAIAVAVGAIFFSLISDNNKRREHTNDTKNHK